MILLPVITIPYISRVLGPTGVGLNTYTHTIIQYFILAGSVGIATYGNREVAYNQKNKAELSQIFCEIILLRFLTISGAVAAFCVFLFFQQQNVQLYLFQGIALVAAAFDISWYFMGKENFKRIVGRNFLVSLTSLFCVFFFVKTPADLSKYIMIVTGSTLFGNLSLWPFMKNELQRPARKLNIGRHLRPTFMLFLPQIAIQLYLLLNKNMIGIFDSISAVGFFGQSDSIIKLTLTLVTSLGTVMLPRVSSLYANGNHRGVLTIIRNSFNGMTALAVPIMFGIMGISLNFAPFFFGEKFAEVGLLMLIQAPVIVFIAWSNVFGVQYLLPLNKLRPYTLSVVAGAIVNIISNLLLIPVFGVFGAMISTSIAEGTVTGYQFLMIRKELAEVELFRGIWKYFLAGFLMFVVVIYLNQRMAMTFLNLVIQIIFGGGCYIALNILLRSKMWLDVRLFFKAKTSS
nr:polysaccharide biosynthesis C-terminal domain-containing protein [Enterococcus sp. MSG2901]